MATKRTERERERDKLIERGGHGREVSKTNGPTERTQRERERGCVRERERLCEREAEQRV